MARAENSDLVVNLRLEDNLSGPMARAKTSVDAAEQSVTKLDAKLGIARTSIARFASAGSQVALIGSTIGGSFGGALEPISDFVRVLGNVGLVSATVADVVPGAAKGIVALGTASAAATPALEGLAVAEASAAVGGTAIAGALAALAAPVAIGAAALVALTLVNQKLHDDALAAAVAQREQARADLELYNSTHTVTTGINTMTVAMLSAKDAADSIAGSIIDATGFLDSLLVSVVNSGTELRNLSNAVGVEFHDSVIEATATLPPFNDKLEEATTNTQNLAGALAALPTTINVDVNVRTNIENAAGGAGALGVASLGPGEGVEGNSGAQSIAEGQAEEADRIRREREADARRAAAERDRLAREAARKAKEDADALAKAYGEKVDAAFDKARKTADTLFDALHRRNLNAIQDAEDLAQTKHDNAIQEIADQLKVEQAAHAAPVEAARAALDQRQAEQRRRDLVEAQLAAANAVSGATQGKGESAEDFASRQAQLLLSLRSATEALTNFDAQAAIDRLTVIQKAQDDASEKRAREAAGIQDEALKKAKAQADIDRDKETIANAKRREDFDTQLAALQKRDEGLKKSPADIQKDIDALSARFGITVDPITGFRHITDPLVTAIKNVKIEPAKVYVTVNVPAITLDGKAVSSALQTSQQPAASSGVRTNVSTVR